MLKGHVFKDQIFENQIFALFINTFLDGHNGIVNNYKNSMEISYSGSNLTINSGAICIQGRFLEEDTNTTLDAGTNTLFCKLILEIDLDKENTELEFNQAYYKILTSESDYPNLTQDEIVDTNSGVYQYELAKFKTGLSGITNFVDLRTFIDFESIYTELENQSTLATKRELLELKEKFEGTVLFEDENGVVDSFQLDVSCAGYKRADVYVGRDVNGQKSKGLIITIDIENMEDRTSPLSYLDDDGSILTMYRARLKLVERTATFTENNHTQCITRNGNIVSSSNKLCIYKIIGYTF